jgi:hypothetical protein
LPIAPRGFAGRAHGVMGRVGTTGDDLNATLDRAEVLLAETTKACR